MTHINHVATVAQDNGGEATLFRVFVADPGVGPQGSRAALDLMVLTNHFEGDNLVRPIFAGPVGETNINHFQPTTGTVTLNPQAQYPVRPSALATYLTPCRLARIMAQVYIPAGPVWTPAGGETSGGVDADWDAFLNSLTAE